MNVAHVVGVACVAGDKAGEIVFVYYCVRGAFDSRGFARMAWLVRAR